MSTAPKKPSSSPTGSGKGKGGTAPPSMQLTEMLAREGAPWRPFEDKGVLVKPLEDAALRDGDFCGLREAARRAPQGRVPVAGEGSEPVLAGRGLLVLHSGVRARAPKIVLYRAVLVGAGRRRRRAVRGLLRRAESTRRHVRRYRAAGTAARSRLRDRRQRRQLPQGDQDRERDARCAPRRARRRRCCARCWGMTVGRSCVTT